jgi:hypothetical protein
LVPLPPLHTARSIYAIKPLRVCIVVQPFQCKILLKQDLFTVL